MRTSIFATVAVAGLLTACAGTTSNVSSPSVQTMTTTDNPLLVESALPLQYPPFDQIRNEHFLPGFEAGMAENRAEIEVIANNPEAPSFDNTIVAMERSGLTLTRVASVFYNLSSSHSNAEIRAAEAEIAPRLSAHRDAIYLNPALFQRVDTLYQQRDTLGLDAEALRLLEKVHTDFVRAGAELGEEQQARMTELNAELSSLTTQFKQNLTADTNAHAVVVDDVNELVGMSADDIAAAASAAKVRGLDGKWLIPLQLPTVPPSLSILEDRDLRERLYRASMLRSNRDDANDNKQLVRRIVQLRAERAALLGYPSHAAYVLDKSTAKTVEAVNTMLGKLTPAAVANARVEAADLQKLVDQDGADFKLAPWDWAFYAERLRKARYAYDETQVRPYLEMERVMRDGVFFMAQQLYGLRFEERHDLPVYHPDVRVFDVYNEDGSLLGMFLADYFARPSKRGGAWMNSFVDQSELFGTQAVVVNNLNVPKPPEGEPVLLTWDEANTMFHEFGHALHGLFSDVKYPYFSGTSVPRDFVEFPSQVHEMWMTDPTVMAHFARHYKTGEPMPQALVDKVLSAQKFNQGFATTEYLAASLLDQAWHQLPVDADISNVTLFEEAALIQAGVKMDEILPRYRSSYFNHVFAGGYSAGYYAYIWSEVLDADTVEWFEENGGLKRVNGDAFRAKLLSRGGSAPALDLFRDFRGRDPEIAPLLERRGLDGGSE